jgi:hypothetical protein
MVKAFLEELTYEVGLLYTETSPMLKIAFLAGGMFLLGVVIGWFFG